MIFPPKRILVPFDFSAVSMEAWRQAKSLSRQFRAVAEALYVEEWIPTGELFQPWRLTPKLRRTLRARVRSEIGNAARVHVLEGSSVVTILRFARIRKPDLIVMGTSGRRGVDRLWRGSVTESVTRLSPVPVLALRGKAKGIRSVLAPVNFTGYSERAFYYAAKFAAAMRATLYVLHVTSDQAHCGNPRFLMHNLIKRLPTRIVNACRPVVDVEEGVPVEKIVAAAGRHDLVVLSAHRKSRFSLGTTAAQVIQESIVPVLAVPAQMKSLVPEPVLSKGRQEVFYESA